jgi:hypothetical protein
MSMAMAWCLLAEPTPHGPPAEEAPAGAPKAAPDEARNLEKTRKHEPEDIALAVPRAILTLPRLVLMGLTEPISEGLSIATDERLARVRAVFFWNERMTVGWLPIASFQSGYGVSFGARLFHEDLFGHEEQLTVEGQFGGLHSQMYEVHFSAAKLRGTPLWLDMRGRYDVNPRMIFAGIGNPPVVPSDRAEGIGPRDGAVRTRYSQQRGLAAARLGWTFAQRRRFFRPGAGFIYNHRDFGEDVSRRAFLIGSQGAAFDPSTHDVYDVERIPGFTNSVDVARVLGTLEFDHAGTEGRPYQGFRWVALGGGAPPQMRDVAYWHYGTEAMGFFNLFSQTRMLVLRAAIEAVHSPRDNLPFTELPRLGGPFRLRGYRLDTFRDNIAVLGTAEYRYPIHYNVAGNLFVDVGRVARDYRDLVSPKMDPWRVGVGGGFRFSVKDHLVFRVDVAYGDDIVVFFSTDPLQAFTDHHMLEL